jgi:23S rRNA pseudouridine2605 synthase
MIDAKVQKAPGKVYLMLNKPNGLVTTRSDELNRPTIYTLLKDVPSFVSPVGRLDMASEGLIFLTNDTDWAHRVCDPQSQCLKTYHVRVNMIPDGDMLARLKNGIDDPLLGLLQLEKVSVLRNGEKNSWLEITLSEGKNRHIRRILEAFDIDVLRLIRVAIGSVKLGELAKGAWRPLTKPECAAF